MLRPLELLDVYHRLNLRLSEFGPLLRGLRNECLVRTIDEDIGDVRVIADPPLLEGHAGDPVRPALERLDGFVFCSRLEPEFNHEQHEASPLGNLFGYFAAGPAARTSGLAP